jgi:SNF family Na+-dependent transporter
MVGSPWRHPCQHRRRGGPRCIWKFPYEVGTNGGGAETVIMLFAIVIPFAIFAGGAGLGSKPDEVDFPNFTRRSAATTAGMSMYLSCLLETKSKHPANLRAQS